MRRFARALRKRAGSGGQAGMKNGAHSVPDDAFADCLGRQ
jgi:hypothetical protein